MGSDYKKIINKIAIITFIFCIKIFVFNTFSLVVQQDQIGIYCIKDNGIKAVGEWVEIDFEGDNYLEYYYFDDKGYLIMNGITPDGYQVNERGQWINNGVVQRKYYQIFKKNEIIKDKNDTAITMDNHRLTNNNNYTFLIVFIIVILLIYLFKKSLSSDKTENKKESYDNYYVPYKPKYYKKSTPNNDTTISRSIWWHLRSDTDKKGEEGEDAASEKLKYLGKDFIVLRNVNLPRNNRDPVQIDFLCISNKGIFVIEVKNWLGTIRGKYEDETWHSEIYDIVNSQRNPIKQNEWHIDVLKRFIKQNMTFYSIIVFTNRADIGWLEKK